MTTPLDSSRDRRPESSDEDLARQFRDGDAGAWPPLLARHSDLLRHCARMLARESAGPVRQEREDETGDLYLYLAEMVQRSLLSFEGRCRLRTWIQVVIGQRAHVLKGYLMRKDRSRADVRVPAVLRDRPAVDREIFRRLVWGLDPRRIALELGVRESACWEVEDLLVAHSPRVHERVRANRLARAAPLRLAMENRDDPDAVEVADPGYDPHQQLESASLERVVDESLDAVLADLPAPQRRLLYLIYNEGMRVAQIAALAAAGDPGLEGLGDLNRCYYLKDCALQAVGDRLASRLREAGHDPVPAARRRVLHCVEDLLRERGVPLAPAPKDRPVSL